MQSLYRVIKNKEILTEKPIVTKDIKVKSYIRENADSEVACEIDDETIIIDAQDKANKILEDAKKILENAKAEVENAKNAGYEEGKEAGYREGESKAIEDYNSKLNEALLNFGKAHDDQLRKIADLKQSYINKTKQELKEFVVEVCKRTINKAIVDETIFDDMIKEIIEEEHRNKKFFIKVNSSYFKHIEGTISKLEESFLNTEIIAVEDSMIEDGNAVIVMEKGRVIIDINKCFDEMKTILESM